MEPDMPPWWFIAIAASVLAVIGVGFIVRLNEPVGIGAIAAAFGWAALAVVVYKRRSS